MKELLASNDKPAQAQNSQGGVRKAQKPLPEDALILIPMRNTVLFPGVITPITVGRSSSASRHCSSRSGQAGSPSSITIDERSRSAETSAFHIIQAVVENHSRRPPGLRSQPRPWFLWCSISCSPWPWTIALGRPVVPEENSTYRGWSTGT